MRHRVLIRKIQANREAEPRRNLQAGEIPIFTKLIARLMVALCVVLVEFRVGVVIRLAVHFAAEPDAEGRYADTSKHEVIGPVVASLLWPGIGSDVQVVPLRRFLHNRKGGSPLSGRYNYVVRAPDGNSAS